MIENDKAYIMQESLQFDDTNKERKIKTHIKPKGSKNIFLRTFGLIPSSGFLPLDKLFSIACHRLVINDIKMTTNILGIIMFLSNFY